MKKILQPGHNRLPVWKRLALSAVVAAVMLPAAPVMASSSSDRMDQVLEILSGQHVSGVAEDKLSEAAIRAMVEAVGDPYTVYMSKEEWTGFQSQLSRNYSGIGVSIGQDGKGLFIGDVFTGSPAAKAGLQAGDYIVRADGHDLTSASPTDAARFIQGEANTEVALEVLRSGQTLSMKVVRQPIQLPVLESTMLDGGVGYVKLYSFSADADEQFAAALQKLKGNPEFRSLVLDLRDNPGGLLDSAARIAAKFIPNGAVIHTKDRSGKDEPVEIQSGERLDKPVYVLVNGKSASCSEVLAGALQDYGAAVIVGTQTFGKGSVQQVYPFQDGASLKVTIEEYYTPKGHPVNKVGIKPDWELEGSLNQLLSVLGKAGVTGFQLEKNRSALTLNGIKISDGLPAFEADSRIWIHSRVLAAMVGAETVWNPETQSVDIRSAGKTDAASFSEELGNARYEEDMMFIDAAAFGAAFPTFTLKGDFEQLELQAGQGRN
jgi:carboxyl-terminal processing protease